MDTKLTILFMLISAVIGLSHVGDDTLARIRNQFTTKRWRELVPGQRRF